MPSNGRGIDPKLQNAWNFSIEREDKVRMKWFRKNEERLNEIVNTKCSKTVSQEVKDQYEQDLIDTFRNAQRFDRKKTPEQPLPVIDETVTDIMRPVDPEITKQLYDKECDGRKRYLHERANLLPENRYYLPECTNWLYGWNVYENMKNIKKYPFGKQRVIEDSFYRRKGVDRDPEWYRQPVIMSPNICNFY